MKKIFLGRGKIDVDDPEEYKYLDSIWEILRNTPDNGITANELGEKSGLSPDKAIPMINELKDKFIHEMTKYLINPFFNDRSQINTDTFWDEHLKNSWLFDKVMLLCYKIDTGKKNDLFTNSNLMMAMKAKWLEDKEV